MRFRPARVADAALLADLFAALVAAGDGQLFHPHPLSASAAREVCGHRWVAGDSPRDEYHVAVDPAASTKAVVGYGLLRGWADGFAVPSLGIAVHPAHRGRGIARRLMTHLHAVAARRGAERVRLKVYRHNTAALRLYESLGYEFQPHSATELVGFLALRLPVAA
jgi:ribosomal-protein-alanine N-acetyltransferase